MKKRLLSLLVAISMVLTFLPVSALTAAAEDSSNGELKIGQNGYPVLDHIPHQTVNGHDIYTGDGWTYDADENCKILTLCPSAPTNYDFWAIHEWNFITNCNLVIGSHAAVTGGSFNASVTNRGTITGGIFGNAVTNHGKINTKTAATIDFSGVAAFLVTNLLLVQCSIAVLLYFCECRPFHPFPSICDP